MGEETSLWVFGLGRSTERATELVFSTVLTLQVSRNVALA